MLAFFLFFFFLFPFVFSQHPRIFVSPGYTIRLPCPIGEGQRWHRVSWETALGQFLATGNSLELREVSPRDSGLYTCRKIRYRRPGQLPLTIVHSVRLVVLPYKGAPELDPNIPPDLRNPFRLTTSGQKLLPYTKNHFLSYRYQARPHTTKPYTSTRRTEHPPQPYTFRPRTRYPPATYPYRPQPYTYRPEPQNKPGPYPYRPEPQNKPGPYPYRPEPQNRPEPYPYRPDPYPYRPEPQNRPQPYPYRPQPSTKRPRPYTNRPEPQNKPPPYPYRSESYTYRPQPYPLRPEPLNRRQPYPYRRSYPYSLHPYQHRPEPQNRPQPYTYRPQPNSYRPQPNTYREQPNSYRQQPNSYREQPNSYRQQPNSYRQQPNSYREQPNSYGPQPNTYRPRTQYVYRQRTTYKPTTTKRLRTPTTTLRPEIVDSGPCLDSETTCERWRGQAPLRRCISQSWICDGESDCGNGWDERECSPSGPCQSVTFECPAEKKNIPITWRCDGEHDCSDGADEKSCVRASFLKSQLSFSGQPGQYFRLWCAARGLPRPRVSWSGKDGTETAKHHIYERCRPESSGDVLRVNSTMDVRVPENGRLSFQCLLSQDGSTVASQTFVIKPNS